MTPSEIVACHLEVQDRIREAYDTLRRLPDDDRRFLTAGERGSWPGYVRDWQAYGADTVRMPRIPPTPGAIDRLHETLAWLIWVEKQIPRSQKILWVCFGKGLSSARAARVVGIQRRTLQRLRRAAVDRIVEQFFGEQKKVA